jgi:hypothetical protein
VECQLLPSQREGVTLLHHHVLLRHERRKGTTAARPASDLLDHLPVFFGSHDPRA